MNSPIGSLIFRCRPGSMSHVTIKFRCRPAVDRLLYKETKPLTSSHPIQWELGRQTLLQTLSQTRLTILSLTDLY